MRGFQFSLERVLSWRRTELRSEEARLGPLVAERGRLEAARAEIVRAHVHAREELLASGPVNGAELEALAHYRAHLEKQKLAVEEKARQCRERIAAQQARIIEAQRPGPGDGEFRRGGVPGALAAAAPGRRGTQCERRRGAACLMLPANRADGYHRRVRDACGCTDR